MLGQSRKGNCLGFNSEYAHIPINLIIPEMVMNLMCFHGVYVHCQVMYMSPQQ